jgi:predicted component of type VI protein secretion system
MPRGKNLTAAHQKAAGRMPRKPFVRAGNIKRKENETVEAAVERYQKAKADVEELDALKRDIEISRLKGDLVPSDEVRDQYEAIHLQWVAELEQLPHIVATALGTDFSASMREAVRSVVAEQCFIIRGRIGSAGG